MNKPYVVTANGQRVHESRVVNGERISATFANCNTTLVRKARVEHECSRCQQPIPVGAAYLEELCNGSRETGCPTCVPCAVARGEAVIGDADLGWSHR